MNPLGVTIIDYQEDPNGLSLIIGLATIKYEELKMKADDVIDQFESQIEEARAEYY